MSRPPVVPPLSLSACIERAQGTAAPLRRRMAAFIYEGVLLFGVLMAVGLVFGIAVGQRHAMHDRAGLQAAVFLSLSLYFIWFWIQGGQTLAMKTWHVRLVRADGLPVTLFQAALRFIMSWLWFWPSLLLSRLAGWHHSREIVGLLLIWIVIYAALSWLLPRRQFLHDVICRTRVIDTRP
ncbi:MAG TPA: RDD family protein [Aquabacterium sp.]|uniref:RDD family protein n=1 Tax=Aquabacterium sp. TaxID=1872578 RepID=UPI002E325B43|nr:RDD family protein [Aquabacterium sp.]HEX5372019.1 RDD family protein [Aquabacterium sp.]